MDHMTIEEVTINDTPYIFKHCFPGSDSRAKQVGGWVASANTLAAS
jgi:hypothetical protein